MNRMKVSWYSVWYSVYCEQLCAQNMMNRRAPWIFSTRWEHCALPQLLFRHRSESLSSTCVVKYSVFPKMKRWIVRGATHNQYGGTFPIPDVLSAAIQQYPTLDYVRSVLVEPSGPA